MRVPCTAVYIRPVLPDLLWILQHTGMFQNTGRLCAVLKKRAAVFLDSKRGT